MSAALRVFYALQRAVHACFCRHIHLRRKGKRFALVLESRTRAGSGGQLQAADERTRREHDELALMLRQLGALLSEQPETRQRSRHLVFVEHALNKMGQRALYKLPLDVLQPALHQLQGLVTNWSPEGLANLRSKMAVAVMDREHLDPEAEAEVYKTSIPLETPAPVEV